MSSSSSSHSGSYSGVPELPLIACKKCKNNVKEFVSKKEESMCRKFYRCNNWSEDGTRCDFFQWQANYAVMLIREGFVTNTDRVIDTIAIAIIDHCRALESHTISIRNNKEKLVKLEVAMNQVNQEVVVLKQELDNLKAAMAQNEAMNQEVEVLKRELNNLKAAKMKGPAANKPRMFSLGLLLLVILIGWFLMRLENGEAFRRGFMLSP